MPQKIIKGHFCPFCSLSFEVENLIVETKSLCHFKNNKLITKKTAVNKIICSNCLNEITMSFIEYAQEISDNNYNSGFSDGYENCLIDQENLLKEKIDLEEIQNNN